MTEEQITKAILDWLERNAWEIICFDFPQSGTGVVLHPNAAIRETKNKGSIIPDIVALRNGIVVFFEDKGAFFQNDFEKVNRLRVTSDYSESITRLLKRCDYETIYYGVGLPAHKITIELAGGQADKIDFGVFVAEDGTIESVIDPASLFP